MPAPSTARPFLLGLSHLRGFFRRYAVELLLLTVLAYLLVQRGLIIQVDLREPATSGPTTAIGEARLAGSYTNLSGLIDDLGDRLSDWLPVRTETDRVTDLSDPAPAEEPDPAPEMSNLTLILSPDYGERNGLAPAVIAAKRRRVDRYLTRYATAARRHQRDYGIPASITLAQALLESNAGDSRLATQSNNHFGIKCRTKCLGCTCRNYGDDTRYDMFRVFNDAEESFAEHSRLLLTPRYARLHAYGSDYRKWAHGLKACGYATDKRYAERLIRIIEELQLDRFDAP